jgi:hypothetical protein
MGKEYIALKKAETLKVSPDREALKSKVSSGNTLGMKKEGLYNKWILIMFGIPYEVEFGGWGLGEAVHVYDENGEEVLTYTGGVGWLEESTQAERKVWKTMTRVYYEAYYNEKKQRGEWDNNEDADDILRSLQRESFFEIEA